MWTGSEGRLAFPYQRIGMVNALQELSNATEGKYLNSLSLTICKFLLSCYKDEGCLLCADLLAALIFSENLFLYACRHCNSSIDPSFWNCICLLHPSFLYLYHFNLIAICLHFFFFFRKWGGKACNIISRCFLGKTFCWYYSIRPTFFFCIWPQREGSSKKGASSMSKSHMHKHWCCFAGKSIFWFSALLSRVLSWWFKQNYLYAHFRYHPCLGLSFSLSKLVLLKQCSVWMAYMLFW